MNKAGVAILIGVLIVLNIDLRLNQPKPSPSPTVQDFRTVDEPVEPQSLFVASDQPAVVIVADLSSEYGSRWLANDAEKLIANGWNVRSLDLQGCEDVRFYVLARGKWLAHNGHMSLSGLKSIVGQ